MENSKQKYEIDVKSLLKFLIYSFIGIFMFFIQITINGKSTIPLDHIVTAIKTNLPDLSSIYVLIIVCLGGMYPFYKRTWKKDIVTMVFSILKVLGIIVAIMAFFRFGPSWLFEKDMVPFLYNTLCVSVGIIVPIGAVFLAFLIGYGLLEFVGVIMRPIMRPIFKTPGRSAIDAVASFVGSYSIGLLITNKVFKEGKYTIKEASIIATGFSTVSVTFMIIVAKTLKLMSIWNKFFWSTFVITFIVTALTIRLRPLRTKEDKYISKNPLPEKKLKGNILVNAYKEGLLAAKQSKNIFGNIKDSLKDGFIMVMGILPSILSVGLIGLILAKYTPIFDILGYIFYPFTALLKIPQPLLASKAAAVGVAEMYLPSLLVMKAAFATKFVIGCVSISSILFLSASIPCILSTDIPINIGEILLVWVERTILSIILAGIWVLLIF